MINVLFSYEQIVKKKSQGQNIIDEASTFFNPYFYDLKISKDYNISKLVEYLMGLYPSLGSIKEIYNITMFAILKVINEDKMKSKFGVYEKLMDFLTNIMSLKDNYYTWFLLEDYGKEPTKVSGQIKIKEEQVGINIFQIINNNNKKKIIYGYLCQSIFINYELIMIDININYYKINKTNLETIKNELEKEIKRIKESNKSYQNLNTYIHLDNTTILYPQSYDLFLQNLAEKNIININQVPEENRSIFDFSRKGNETQITPQQNGNKKEVINNKEDINNNNRKTWIDRVKNQFANNEGENNKNNDNNSIFNCKTFIGYNDNVNKEKFIGNNQIIQGIQNNGNDNLQVNQLKEELEKEKLKNKDLSEN
jgi:hypothetical protein